MNEKLKKIKLIISDVDGVLTDGSLYYSNDDGGVEPLKVFNARDGLGIRLLAANQIALAVLSGRDSKALRNRLQNMKVKHFSLGQLEKTAACFALMEEVGVTAEETAYIGDDTIDLPAFAVCGVSFAVADAADYIQEQADIVLTKAGGKGAFREVVDMVLTAQGKRETFTNASVFSKLASQMAQ